MKRLSIAFTAIGLGALAHVPVAQAEDEQQGIREIMRTFRLNITRAEVGLSASGIVGADYLHAAPAVTSGAISSGGSAAAQASGSAADSAASYSSSSDAAAAAGASSASAAAYTDSGAGTMAAVAEDSSGGAAAASSGGGSYSGGGGSGYSSGGGGYSGGGKGVMSGGKDVMGKGPAVIMPDPPKPWYVSLDGGYQSRYYFHGLNQILNATGGVGAATPEDTDMWYGGITAGAYGFNAGLKYIRGTTDLETRFSINPIVVTTYEEWVYHANYAADLIPGGHLNATIGYTGISFPEETFYNTKRQDDFYVRIGNASIPYRPSVAYHYLDGASPLTTGTISPGVQILDGELIVAQVDGQLDLPNQMGVPFDVTYYAQFGFDNDYNVRSDFDHDWIQCGVAVPFYAGPATISPYWAWNQRQASPGIPRNDENFWGVNVRLTF